MSTLIFTNNFIAFVLICEKYLCNLCLIQKKIKKLKTMMSIIILVGAYRYYAGLAERFGKTKWHFGLLAIAVYLGFQILFLVSYKFYEVVANPNVLNENNYNSFSGVNLISWIFAIGCVYGVHRILENRFKKEMTKNPVVEIEEIGNKEL